jgi:molybdate transport system ATP-binding protein
MLDVSIRMEFSSQKRETAFALDARFAAGEEITMLFGPSGSGKTTILRAIAGILTPGAGRIAVNGNVYFDSQREINLPVRERRVGFVFQDYLLFPHLTAEQNVAYGVRQGSERARRKRAGEMLSLLGIRHAAERLPDELSGGEQQRVALARALGSEPQVLLLDEPLSAVDVSTRSRLLQELAGIQRQSRIPFLYVTHSPAEAVRAGDRVLILEQGRIVQQGRPQEVFNSPRDVPTARAVGDENLLRARVVEQLPAEGITRVDAAGCRLALRYQPLPLESTVTVGIPSEDIIISRDRISQTSARNLLPGSVKHVIRDEPAVELVIDCGVDLKVRVTPQAVEALAIRPGVKVYLLIKATACRVLN